MDYSLSYRSFPRQQIFHHYLSTMLLPPAAYHIFQSEILSVSILYYRKY